MRGSLWGRAAAVAAAVIATSSVRAQDAPTGTFLLEGERDGAPIRATLEVRPTGSGFAVERTSGTERLSGTAVDRGGRLVVRFHTTRGAAQVVAQVGAAPADVTGTYSVRADGTISGSLSNPSRIGGWAMAREKGARVCSMEEFARGIPKTELHLHIEGSLEPEMMFALSKKNAIPIKFKTVEEVKAAYDFTDLQSFLDIYYEGAKVLITEQDFYDMTWAYLERAKKANVRHAEIFFDPQTHTDRGIAFETVVKGIHRALEDGRAKLGITTGLILCFLRHLPADQCMRTLEMALPYKQWIVGVGLDSSEVGHPPIDFKDVYDRARAAGFRAVAHAGEEGPPEYVYQALDLLKVERVDHGNRCLEDPKLVERLVREKMPLTVCPFSNVKLRVVKTLEEHPLRRMLSLGLKATVNSDDPAYFGGYVGDNVVGITKSLGLSREEVVTVERNGIEASFISDGEKKRLLEELETFVRAHPTR